MALATPVGDIVQNSSDGRLSKHDSWERIDLRFVANVLNGAAFKSEQFSRDSGLPLLRIRDVSNSTTETRYDGPYEDKYLVSFGDLVVGMDGDFNSAIWQGSTALLNQRVCKVQTSTENYDPLFLHYTLPGYLKAIHAHTSSVTVKHLSSKSVQDIPLPLPPLNEQRRIVEKIEELFTKLDAGVESLRKTQALLKKYRQSVLKAAVTGELSRELREEHSGELEPASELLERILKERREKWTGKKYKEPTLPEVSGLPKIPSGWLWTRLDTIAFIKGGVTKDSKREVAGTRKVPYLRVANVQRGYLDLSEMKEIEVGETVIAQLRLYRGDILFNEGGDRDKLGRGWVWENELEECIHQNHVFRARPVNTSISSKLVSWFGNTFGQPWFMQQGKQTTNLASINLTKLSAFPIPLQSSEEQAYIVSEVERRLSIVDSLEATVEENLKRSEGLRQSILKRAFSGRLVPQDPDDEPASVLLERIREERLTTNQKSKKRRSRKQTPTESPSHFPGSDS